MTVTAAIDGWVSSSTVRAVPGEPVVVAVSGGVDSMVLASALARVSDAARLNVILAHFQHHIRDACDEATDLRVVRALAGRLGSACYVGAADHDERGIFDQDGGPESIARARRYRFLVRVCGACDSRILLTAHHADDQAETILMRLLSGVTGTSLAGIPPTGRAGDVVIHRPLLAVAHEDIERQACSWSLEWSEDRTNAQRTITRNRVRHEVLPAVREFWPAVSTDLCTLGASFAERRRRIDSIISTVPVDESTHEIRIARAPFFALPSDARLELLYGTLTRAGFIRRSDRPSHRFFAPLLGADRRGSRTAIAGRGLRARLDGDFLVIRFDVVRSPESGYLA